MHTTRTRKGGTHPIVYNLSYIVMYTYVHIGIHQNVPGKGHLSWYISKKGMLFINNTQVHVKTCTHYVRIDCFYFIVDDTYVFYRKDPLRTRL
jgi:hypothetical protein